MSAPYVSAFERPRAPGAKKNFCNERCATRIARCSSLAPRWRGRRSRSTPPAFRAGSRPSRPPTRRAHQFSSAKPTTRPCTPRSFFRCCRCPARTLTLHPQVNLDESGVEAGLPVAPSPTRTTRSRPPTSTRSHSPPTFCSSILTSTCSRCCSAAATRRPASRRATWPSSTRASNAPSVSGHLPSARRREPPRAATPTARSTPPRGVHTPTAHRLHERPWLAAAYVWVSPLRVVSPRRTPLR